MSVTLWQCLTAFQSTRPLRGATASKYKDVAKNYIFQSTRPLRGATRRRGARSARFANFNPRAPCGARPTIPHKSQALTPHFNPRAPCGARPNSAAAIRSRTISIHAPLAGRDGPRYRVVKVSSKFQSTRPLRGATLCKVGVPRVLDISIHAPLAGRDLKPLFRGFGGRFNISIHAPLAGRDDGGDGMKAAYTHFNPRAPCGARQPPSPSRRRLQGISIHAPLAGRDPHYSNLHSLQRHFNPRAPCGARLNYLIRTNGETEFQSTRPLRGATAA